MGKYLDMARKVIAEQDHGAQDLVEALEWVPGEDISGSFSIDHLTGEGKEVYWEYIGEMLFPKYGPTLTLEKAKSLAMEKVSCSPGNLRENIKE